MKCIKLRQNLCEHGYLGSDLCLFASFHLFDIWQIIGIHIVLTIGNCIKHYCSTKADNTTVLEHNNSWKKCTYHSVLTWNPQISLLQFHSTDRPKECYLVHYKTCFQCKHQSELIWEYFIVIDLLIVCIRFVCETANYFWLLLTYCATLLCWKHWHL